MRYQVLASGSGGNCALVRAGALSLLVDAGMPADELLRRLEAARLAPGQVDAIALTHGHLDHARGAGMLARKCRARVYCNQRMMRSRSVRRAPSLATLTIGSPQVVRASRGDDELTLLAVPVPHDADPTVALRLEHRGRTIVHVTDMGAPDAGVARALAGAHVLSLEFNHDPRMLADGPYPAALKRRVAGPRGHLSNAEAATVLRALAGPELHTVVLTHISVTNNTPELAGRSAHEALAALGRTDVRVLVAEQDAIGPIVTV